MSKNEISSRREHGHSAMVFPFGMVVLLAGMIDGITVGVRAAVVSSIRSIVAVVLTIAACS